MVFMCYERSPLLLRDWRAEFVRSVYKQNTVQMIDLVLKHAREKSLRTQGDFFPLPVEKRHANAGMPGDGAVYAGNGKTAFFVVFHVLRCLHDARIHDYERFPVCRNHGETHAVIHLRRSKPYPVRGWHGFEHDCDRPETARSR